MKTIGKGSPLSLNDYKFIRDISKNKPGRIARVETRYGKYWVRVAPATFGYLDCEICERHDATGEFVPSRAALEYDSELAKGIVELAKFDGGD